MPLYEYQCAKCDKIVEVIQKFSDAPLTECPNCGSPVEKLLSRSSFHLKGGGWYKTDYKKPATGAPAAAASTDTKAPAGETATKPEAP